MQSNSNLEVALALAGAGLFIFPVDGPKKKSHITGWRHRASTDLLQMHRWWQAFPNAVPGLELGKCGLVVLDADRHPGGADGVEALNALLGADVPRHPITLSSGGGQHHFFAQPKDGEPLGCRKKGMPKGIDVKGRGGLVLGPGSVRPDGKTYRPDPDAPSLADAFVSGTIPVVPAHIVAMIRPTSRPASRPSISQRAMSGIAPRGTGATNDRAERYGWSGLSNECRKVSIQQSGDRNNQLNASSFSVGQLVGAGMVERNTADRFLFLAAEQCGLVDDDGADRVRATITSGLTSGMRHPRALPEQPRSILRMTIEIETPND